MKQVLKYHRLHAIAYYFLGATLAIYGILSLATIYGLANNPRGSSLEVSHAIMMFLGSIASAVFAKNTPGKWKTAEAIFLVVLAFLYVGSITAIVYLFLFVRPIFTFDFVVLVSILPFICAYTNLLLLKISGRPTDPVAI